MNKHLVYLTFVIGLILISCGTDKKQPEQKEFTKKNNPDIVHEYTTDTFYFSDEYPEVPSQVIYSILDSMKLCAKMKNSELPDSLQPVPCSNEFFGVFANSTSKNWENGFLLEARQGVWARSSRVFNIEKSDLGFVVTNDLKGQLLYMIPNKNGKNKIVLRYFDSKVGTISVEHEWQGGSYKPKNVVLINDFPIKKEFTDSLNHYYLDNFVWGY